MNTIMHTNFDSTPPSKSQRSVIMSLYAFFGAGLLLSVVPMMSAAFLSMLFIIGVFFAAYILRAGQPPDSFRRNHCAFIIRTLWVGSFITLVTIIMASLFLYFGLDHTPLLPCMRTFTDMGQNMGIDPANSFFIMMDPAKLMYAFGGCLQNYITVNLMVFIASFIIAAGPVLLYFIIRYARGLKRAVEGQMFANPRAWF